MKKLIYAVIGIYILIISLTEIFLVNIVHAKEELMINNMKLSDYVEIGYLDFLIVTDDFRDQYLKKKMGSKITLTDQEKLLENYLEGDRGNYLVRYKKTFGLSTLKKSDIANDGDVNKINNYLQDKQILSKISPHCLADGPVVSSLLGNGNYTDALLSLAMLKGRMKYKNDLISLRSIKRGNSPYQCYSDDIDRVIGILSSKNIGPNKVSQEVINQISQQEYDHLVSTSKLTSENFKYNTFYKYINVGQKFINNIVELSEQSEIDTERDIEASIIEMKIHVIASGVGFIFTATDKTDDIIVECATNLRKEIGEIEPIPYDGNPVLYAFNQSNKLSDGLIAYWNFDKCDANDVSGNNTGTISGKPECVSGVKGKALKFTHGSGLLGDNGDHVLLKDNINFGELQNFSMCLWVNEEGFSYPHGESYISFGDDSDGGFLTIGHFGDFNSIGYLKFSVGNTTEGLTFPFNQSDRNQFIFYCMVYKNGVITAYKNASLIGSKSQKKNIYGTNAAIARHWWSKGASTSTRLKGTIDEIRIFNRVLSRDEINLLYRN